MDNFNRPRDACRVSLEMWCRTISKILIEFSPTLKRFDVHRYAIIFSGPPIQYVAYCACRDRLRYLVGGWDIALHDLLWPQPSCKQVTRSSTLMGRILSYNSCISLICCSCYPLQLMMLTRFHGSEHICWALNE
jgi:hypothetical protein